jgi:hypothetical protein
MRKTVGYERKSTALDSPNQGHWLFPLLCCSPLFAVRARMLLTPPHLYDFITYWSAGRLFLTGGHPYSMTAMLATERSQGWAYTQPLMTFCPPWGLPILAVMSLPPFRAAQIGWFAISLILNCFSALGLWNYFGGEKRIAWIAVLVCATFIPMGGAEQLGQITPLILASLTAFLLLLRSERYFFAGVILLGFGAKPHLLYLVLLAILFWVVKKRAWTTLAGAAASYGTATIAALVYNPNSQDYLRHTFGAAVEVTCSVGGALRSIFGVQQLWLQFLPCFFGIAWFLSYWVKHRRQWDWQAHLPLLLIVSIASSPYFWFHDFILILPALIAVAVRGGYRSVDTLVAYLVVQGIVVAAFGLSMAWMCVASLLWIAFYFIAKSATPSPKIPVPEVASVLP